MLCFASDTDKKPEQPETVVDSKFVRCGQMSVEDEGMTAFDVTEEDDEGNSLAVGSRDVMEWNGVGDETGMFHVDCKYL